jgi:hypothetical protein
MKICLLISVFSPLFRIRTKTDEGQTGYSPHKIARHRSDSSKRRNPSVRKM